jgi:hypothetical protein
MMKEQVMRAIRFKAFGDPSVLELAEVAAPSVSETTALVRVMAASINPSDVKNVAGAMKQTTLPRIPGRDFAGVVEAGPAEWIGAAVWGTGGDTGFTRDGTHAEVIAVLVASLRRKPDILSFDQADFYHNESRLYGVDTLKRDLTASAEVLEALTPGFVAGDYRAAPITETCGLGEAQEACRKVGSGSAGRVVLRPQE